MGGDGPIHKHLAAVEEGRDEALHENVAAVEAGGSCDDVHEHVAAVDEGGEEQWKRKGMRNSTNILQQWKL